MPTIALLNGHAFAGGLMLAMYHDYRIFNPTRGFLCLNELDLGVPLKPPMASIFRQKLPAATFQKLVLEAKRFTAKEALDAGLVDALGGMDELLGFVRERKLTEKTRGGVYAVLRAEMWRETLGYLEGFEEGERRDREFGREEARRETEGRRRVDEWEKSSKGKAKL
jgi:enoyl-CoA hydratase/carnithine racemase